MDTSIAKKIFLFMSPPYRIMKSTFGWIACWQKWVLQWHPVLRVHFIIVAVRWAQNRKAVKVFYNAGTGVNTWKVRTFFTNYHCNFHDSFAYAWNWKYTARQLSSREWIWIQISNVGAPERNTLKRQTVLQQPVWSLHWCHLSNRLACARWQHRGMIPQRNTHFPAMSLLMFSTCFSLSLENKNFEPSNGQL